LYYILCFSLYSTQRDVPLETGTMSPEIISHTPPVPLLFTQQIAVEYLEFWTPCFRIWTRVPGTLIAISFSQHLTGQTGIAP